VTAGRKKNKNKRKRYTFGPKKGEVITSSDESVDALLINSSEWSASSDDLQFKAKKTLFPILAKGPRPKKDLSESESDEHEAIEQQATPPKDIDMKDIMGMKGIAP